MNMSEQSLQFEDTLGFERGSMWANKKEEYTCWGECISSTFCTGGQTCVLKSWITYMCQPARNISTVVQVNQQVSVLLLNMCIGYLFS